MEGIAPVKAQNISCGVRAASLPMATLNILRQPSRKRLVGENILELGEGSVGRVRISEIEMEEPVILCAAPPQPIQSDFRNLVGSLQAISARVKNLVEIGVPVQRGVTLSERAGSRRVIAAPPHDGHPTRFRKHRAEAALRPFWKRVRGSTPVSEDAL